MNTLPPRVPNTRFTLRATSDPINTPKNQPLSPDSETPASSGESWTDRNAGKTRHRSRGKISTSPLFLPPSLPFSTVTATAAHEPLPLPSRPDPVSALAHLEERLRIAKFHQGSQSCLQGLVSSGLDLVSTILSQSRAEIRREIETVEARMRSIEGRVKETKKGKRRGRKRKTQAKKCECLLREGKKMKKRDRNAALAAEAIVSLRAEKGGNPEEVKDSQRRRFKDVELVDTTIALDQKWRKVQYELEQKQREYGQINKQVVEKKKVNRDDPCAEEVARLKELDTLIETEKKLVQEAHAELKVSLNLIGNIVHPSVPVSRNEIDNRIERTWGEPWRIEIDNTPGHYMHNALLYRINGYDSERGQKVVGHRGYFLKGPGVLLNQALINYGIQFLMRKQYTPVQTPFFIKKSMMALTAELADFDDQLYKVSTGQPDDEGYYLIATSEQPISVMHQGEWLAPKTLPLRYSGVSSCFRKEAGAHGKDTWGIFRIHQFEKIEQFCITVPEKSWEMHEEMIGIAEEFYRSLNIPYRVVAIVSGELNGAAAKKYDLEGWYPSYGTYRELVSCSNCTDFQSRAAEVRCGTKKKNQTEKQYVHMLNATLCATERTLCCLLENYQTPDGVKVPDVLKPYMGGIEFIPFDRELIKEENHAFKKENPQLVPKPQEAEPKAESGEAAAKPEA